MTLKAGRLGIGTSEPKAALDVRGGACFKGIVSTGMPAIFGAINNYLTTATVDAVAQNISVVQFSQGPSMKRGAGGIYFPVPGMYMVQLATHMYIGGGASAVKSITDLARYNNAGTLYSKTNRGSIVDQTLGTTGGNSDTNHVTTWLINANGGDYAIISHSTAPATLRNYNNEWNYISAVCLCTNEAGIVGGGGY